MSSDVRIIVPKDAPSWLQPVVTDIERAFRTREDEIVKGSATQVWNGNKEWITLSATNVAYSPTGTIAANTVQAAVAEVSGDVTALTSSTTTALAGKQPLDDDLTAISALTTTSYGRGFLALTDAAAGRTSLSISAANTPSNPSGTISATNVQSALQELDTEKAPKASPSFTGVASAEYFNAEEAYRISGGVVLKAPRSGWSAPTGTSSGASFASYSAGSSLTVSNPPTQAEVQAIATRLASVESSLQAVSRALHQLVDDCLFHGFIES